MTKLQQMLGPRGGITAAIRTLRALGAKPTRRYLVSCVSGASLSARIYRKHNIIPDPARLARLKSAPNDPLITPARKKWWGDLDLVRFGSGYGSWKNNGSVPMGGYFTATNPGYGRSPRVVWHLRTGGYITPGGYLPPKKHIIP